MEKTGFFLHVIRYVDLRRILVWNDQSGKNYDTSIYCMPRFYFLRKKGEIDCGCSVLLVSGTVSLIIYIPVDCRIPVF